MLSLGIDVGATKAHGVVLDDSNTIVAEVGAFSRRGPVGLEAVLLHIANSLAAKLGVGLRDFDSVGIGVPGMVNPATGEITAAVNLNIEHMSLRSTLAPHFAVPLRVDNDVKVTAIAAGMLLDSLSVTYVNFGTGVAAATLAGRLIRGHDNAAGELGHLVLDPDGEPCRCGQRGCLETIVGGRYLAPRMDFLGLNWTRLGETTTPAGRAARDQAVRVIARLVTIVSVAYASEHVVLGGGVIQAAPWTITAVKQFLIERGETATFPPYASIAARISTLSLDRKAPAIGAALIGQGWTEGYKA
ncbi:MAG: ROK family protein [Propionibacteriaceae bacterium]|jgi:predicted NBD/HSP70 family sugar kinase|nr:ROK family protein [Propionibacteriaceae bacterium]